MPRYQETTPHEDTTRKRPFSPDDLLFLAALQHTLNTQDNMGNADPLFWVIRQSVDVACAPDEADKISFIDKDGNGEVADGLDAFVEYLKEHHADDVRIRRDRVIGGWSVSAIGDGNAEYVTEPDEMIDALESAGIYRYCLGYSRKEPAVAKDTLFLTHRACEDHLRNYGYNYAPDAHAFAMTAIRSPEYARLLSILKEIDWGSVPAYEPDPGSVPSTEVTLRVSGRFRRSFDGILDTEAALSAMDDACSEADFGPLEDIEWDIEKASVEHRHP